MRGVALALFLVACTGGRAHPQPPEVAPVPGPLRQYRIQFGDTLEGIAWRFEVPGGYPALAALNHLDDPDFIGGGEPLLIPNTPVAAEVLPVVPTAEPFVGRLDACATAEVLPGPRESWLADCTASACVDIDPSTRVCACDTSSAETDHMRLLRESTEVARWPVRIEVDPGEPWEVMGTVRDFEVVRADLDGDGPRELLVAFRRVHDDAGMSWWDVAVVGTDDGVTRAELGAYGRGTLLAAPSGCALLGSEWMLAIPPPSRMIPRWHLVGRVLEWRDGQLVGLQPGVVARRLLYSYQPGQVEATGAVPVGTPAADLVHPTAQVFAVEPALQAERWTREEVVVEAWGPSELVLRGPSNPRRFGGRTRIRVGDASTRTLLPVGYQPAHPERLVGRAAVLERYADAPDGSGWVLWLTPAAGL